MLWVDDLLNAYALALVQPEQVAGRTYNIGGGPAYTLAIWTEVGPILEVWPVGADPAQPLAAG